MKPRFSAGLMGAVMILLLSQAGCTQKKKSVNEIAKEVTVFIDGCSWGSGVIFQKEGNTYSVLTARHVVSNDVDCLVITPDGETHQAKANKFKVYEGLDLAVMQFESSKEYQRGELEKSEKATLGQKISIAGAPIPNETITKRTLRVSDGTIISTPTEGTLGRTLVYNNTSKQGMSGGPVLDEQGWVIGIHTAADPKDGGREAYGIPIQKFLTGKVSQKPKDQDADTYLSKGFALSLKKDYKEAITNYDQAIKLNPNLAEAYNNRGNVRDDLGDKQGAIADYDQAIKLNPNWANAYIGRGHVRSELGDKQGALTDFDQGIKLNPNVAAAYNNRGGVRFELGDKQSAFTDFDQAIKLNPNFALAYNNKGQAHSELGDKQGAIDDYTQAIKLNPNFAAAYGNRGVARSELGDKSGAIKDLLKAAELFQQQGSQKGYQQALEVLKKLQ